MSVVPASQVDLGQEDVDAVCDVLWSGEVGFGRCVARFERSFADWLGTRCAVGVSSGSEAVHIALRAHGIGRGDDVVTSAFTPLQTAKVGIELVGARPLYVDIDPHTCTMDTAVVETLVRAGAKAIVAVHAFGHPCNMRHLERIAQQHGAVLVEDACQALGASYRGRPVGSFGTGCFSCDEQSVIAVGHGGVVTTNEPRVARRARRLRKKPAAIGYDCPMTNLAAVLGLCQLRRIGPRMKLRRDNALLLARMLSALPEVCVPALPNGSIRGCQYLPVRLGRRATAACVVTGLLRRHGFVADCVSVPTQVFTNASAGPSYAEHLQEGVIALAINPFWDRESLRIVARLIADACVGEDLARG